MSAVRLPKACARVLSARLFARLLSVARLSAWLLSVTRFSARFLPVARFSARLLSVVRLFAWLLPYKSGHIDVTWALGRLQIQRGPCHINAKKINAIIQRPHIIVFFIRFLILSLSFIEVLL